MVKRSTKHDTKALLKSLSYVTSQHDATLPQLERHASEYGSSSSSSSTNKSKKTTKTKNHEHLVDYYEVKNSVLASYLIDLLNYHQLQFQSQPQSQATSESDSDSDSHNAADTAACLERLQEMKCILSKIRPMEKKMRYQIDKLLAYHPVVDVDVDREEGEGEEEKSSDPLSFRPNPEGLVSKMDDDSDSDEEDSDDDDDDEEDSNDEDDDDDLKAAKEALRSSRKSPKPSSSTSNNASAPTDAIYKAPRLESMPYPTTAIHDDPEKDDTTRSNRRDERNLQRQMRRNTELLETLRSVTSNSSGATSAPDEEDADGGATLGKRRESTKKLMRKEAQREEFEETHMIRLTTSRKEKVERNRVMRMENSSGLNALADMGGVAGGIRAFGRSGGNGQEEEDGEEGGKRRRKSTGKNSFQKALYGTEGDKPKSSKKKRSK